MQGGFHAAIPNASAESDDQVIERTCRFRRAFNEHFRVHGCVTSASIYAESVTAATRLRLLPKPPDVTARWGDAA